jgi:hypothetical protein
LKKSSSQQRDSAHRREEDLCTPIEPKGKTTADVKLEHLKKLSEQDIKKLQEKYSTHLQRTRIGFLTTAVRKRLLHLENWPEDTNTDDIYQYFYDLREHAKAAIDDFRLLSDVLKEKEFERIFGEKIIDKEKGERYPISAFFEILVPETIQLRNGVVVPEILEEQKWRKNVLEEITIKSLLWYESSGIIQTDCERRLLIDAADIIGVRSSGKKPFFYRPDEPIPNPVR